MSSFSSLKAEPQFDTTITEPLFTSKRFADFMFCFKGAVHLRAHKFILDHRCTNGPWKDLNTINEWHERTINVYTFMELLEFIYTNKLPGRITTELMLAATAYGVLDLKVACERYFIDTLTVANAVITLSIIESNPGASEDVKKEVRSFIQKNIRGPEGKSLFMELAAYSSALAYEMFII